MKVKNILGFMFVLMPAISWAAFFVHPNDYRKIYGEMPDEVAELSRLKPGENRANNDYKFKVLDDVNEVEVIAANMRAGEDQTKRGGYEPHYLAYKAARQFYTRLHRKLEKEQLQKTIKQQQEEIAKLKEKNSELEQQLVATHKNLKEDFAALKQLIVVVKEVREVVSDTQTDPGHNDH